MITVKKGKFAELLDNGDPHLKGAVDVKRLIDEAREDFPNVDNYNRYGPFAETYWYFEVMKWFREYFGDE